MYQSLTIVGRLGADPELRYTPAGKSVCSFSVAVDRRYKASDGQSAKETTWFRVTAWGKLAENCAAYLSKGKLALIEGTVKARAYQKDGEPQASLDITAGNVTFLSAKGETEEMEF